MDNKDVKTKEVKKKGINNTSVLNALSFLYHYKYFSAFLISLLILILGYLFMIRPQMQSIFDVQKQTEEIKQEVKKKIAIYDSQINDLEVLLSAYEKISSSEKQAVEQILPDNQELKELFSQVTIIVEGSGLLLDSIEVFQEEETSGSSSESSRRKKTTEIIEEDNTGIQKISIRININGISYPALKNLLASLQNNSRIINIQNIDFDPQDRKAEITLQAYYFKNKAEN